VILSLRRDVKEICVLSVPSSRVKQLTLEDGPLLDAWKWDLWVVPRSR